MASEIGQNIIPRSFNVFLNVVATETESITISTATLDKRFCSSIEIPSLAKVFNTKPSKYINLIKKAKGNVCLEKKIDKEKSLLLNGLVIDGFVWTDPYKPMATPTSKPPYGQCEAVNLTKKTPLYTVCGTEDVYCKALDFLGS